MAQVETLGIVPESKAVFELIMRYLTALVESKSPPPPHHHLHEFDDCQYLVHGDSAGGLRLSFALPCLEDCFREQLLTENTLELIQGAYQGMATVLQPPEPGYQVSLQLEVRVLTRISPADRAYWEYFVKPHAQSVTVILPVRFLTVQDAAIGHAVLQVGVEWRELRRASQPYPWLSVAGDTPAHPQEFADARRQASLGNAPSCAYFPAKVSGNFIIADSGVGRIVHGLLGLDPSVCHAPAEWSLTRAVHNTCDDACGPLPFAYVSVRARARDVILSQPWQPLLCVRELCDLRAPISAQSPPPEVLQVPAALLDGVSGFMSFTVTERHVRAAHIEEVVWSLHTFRILIGFHITSCKCKFLKLPASLGKRCMDCIIMPTYAIAYVCCLCCTAWAMQAMIHARMRVCADRLSSSLDLRGTQPMPLDISARQPVALTQANHPAGWKPVQP
ncbi:hypothetical protein QJQ45_027794 [Haematococcus lacustris]|nr:hypothetical protein QJQ45_027794 [Haematococcus lacustris]